MNKYRKKRMEDNEKAVENKPAYDFMPIRHGSPKK